MSAKRLSTFVVSMIVSGVLSGAVAFANAQASAKAAGTLTPKVSHSVKHGTSQPLRDIKAPARPSSGHTHAMPGRQRTLPSAPRGHDGVVQQRVGPTQPTPQTAFAGSSAADDSVANLGAVSPSDSVLDVGAGHIVQTVNSVMQVWDTDGNQQLAPIATTSLFESLGGQCGGSGFNAVDTVVRYDELAGRWVLAFIPYDFNFAAPFSVCVAVSTSSDPTDTWSTYSYDFDNLLTNPRLGVWPDGYYLGFDQLDSGFNFSGVMSIAFDRSAMIAGAETATAIQFSSNSFLSLVPADLDGGALPAEGTPNHQASPGEANWDGSPSPVIHMFEFHADFANPGNSTFTGPFDVAVPDFNPVLCGGSFSCIPALGGAALNPNAGFLMNGMQYRNMGDHESLVVSQTVNVSEGGDQAGVRWYEIRPAPAGAQGGASPFSLYQSGTYAPTDTNRFIPSIAMDVSGDMAMGYSVSDATIHPQIGLTGRLSSDPLGDMGSELTVIAGNGSQQSQYWGNYSGMVVDPSDGCTFWYTNQYYDTNDDFNWLTRVASFRFPSCTSGPSGTLQGTVTDGTNPIAGAKVTAGASSTTTNAAGQYSFTLPVGAYDMTASKYGYLPGSANGVAVTDGGTTNQDFTLGLAPSVSVNGVVKDAETGWPLYAKVTITASGAPTFTMYTDPVTGYYSQTLVTGIPYTFVVRAVAQGYQTGGGVVPFLTSHLAPDATVVNWNLTADPVLCNAPGYSFSTMVGQLFEPFDSGIKPIGWTQTNFSNAGVWRFPTSTDECGEGNNTGGSGGFAIIDSDCDGLIQDDVALNTPPLDLSAQTTAILQFNSDYFDLGSVADADISTDGVNWTNVWERAGSDDRGPTLQTIDITGMAAGQSAVQARFHFQGFWAWWWEIDNVLLGDPEAPIAPPPACVPGTGGLVVGNVISANSGAGLNGATVANMTNGGSVKTFATPDDPNQPDGMYILYSESGSNDLQASLSLYGSDQHTVVVLPGGTVRQNFVLQSGNVSAAPTRFDGRVNPGASQNMQMTLSNSGGASAAFQVLELNSPAQTSHTSGFASNKLRKEALARLHDKAKITARSSRGLAPLPNAPRASRPMAVGDVLASYPSSIAYGWGVASSGTTFWLSNLGVAGGDDKDYQYDSASGAQTGNVQPDSFASSGSGTWAADGAFDPLTGNFWRVLVGGDNCIYELNPSSGPTGNKVCGSPWANTSQRGLAYDITNNAFFVGGWNEGIVYHVDASGNVIDSANVGLQISGLAYAPGSGHLLVMSNQSGAPDVTVLDALNNYAVVGTFYIGGSSPVMTAFGQAGMEFDCAGNLWVIDQNTQTIYQVDSGESVACSVDIPWLTVNPTEGTLGAAGNGASSTQQIALGFVGGTLLPGLRQAQLQVKTDTPVAVPAVPVTLTVRFNDVPDNNQFQAYIYGAAGAGVMFGGPPVCTDVLTFCPNGVVTRADMSGYLFRAIHGVNTPPPVYQNIFADVHFNDYNAFYIQGIYDDGITAGCGDGTIYCPNAPNTRAQMAVFIWKGLYGSEAPPACSGVFADVACPSLFADYIEAIYQLGVTGGCGQNPLIYCPNSNITNGQMATFLVKAFNIPYLQ